MSFTSLRYHIITATKNRRRLITSDIERRLFNALRREAENLGGKVFIVNGVEDHVHIVVAIPATIAVSTFVGKLKAYASRIVRKRYPGFAWQDGYAAFTVSSMEMTELINYVYHQKSHHSRGTTTEGRELPRDM